MIESCHCGHKAFQLNAKYKTATCRRCGLMWETNDDGDIVSALLPNAHTKAEQEQEQKTVSVLDVMLDLT